MTDLSTILTRRNGAIFIIWLFHVSAIIGIGLGYFEWFVTKTPINLLLIGILVVLVYPVGTEKSIRIALFIYLMGMAVEWIGVHYEFLFGAYAYGENLGPKIDGVPWLIGVNWMVLILVTAAISNKVFTHWFLRTLFGALLMVFLDLFIEQSAPLLDFWSFSAPSVPFRNYLAWFFISAFLHYIYQRSRLDGDFVLSFHTYLAQLTFFLYLYGIYGI
ncbi:MAG: carotenoid biosynthesis protein [Cyclobacteriaceae bacterium]